MPLDWKNTSRKDRDGNSVSESFDAQLPHWGRATVHQHIYYPGESLLSCRGLGIDMLPLGKVRPADALKTAEAALLEKLERYAAWSEEAIQAIQGPNQTMERTESP